MDDSNLEEQTTETGFIDPTTLPRNQRSAYWSERIQIWRQSGLSQTAFCRQEKLVPHQFTYWLSKCQSTSPSVKRENSANSFIPIAVVPSAISQLQITLPNGIVLTGITDQNLDLAQQFIQSL